LSESASEIMRDLAIRFFHNQCEVTLSKFNIRGFVIHHVHEIQNDVLRKQFPKGVKGRDDYLRALKPLVEECPERFALIKNSIHAKLDHVRNGITRMKMEDRQRFCYLALRTVHKRRKRK